MKKVLHLCSLLFLIANGGSSFAEPPPVRHQFNQKLKGQSTQSPEQNLRTLQKKLDLSSEQKGKIESIYKSVGQQCKGSSDLKSYKDCLNKQSSTTNYRIRAELSASQAKDFEKLYPDKKGKTKGSDSSTSKDIELETPKASNSPKSTSSPDNKQPEDRPTQESDKSQGPFPPSK